MAVAGEAKRRFFLSPQRVLIVGLFFLAGCMLTFLYTSSNVQGASPLVSSEHLWSGETLSKSKEPDVQRSRVKLPVVTDVLPGASPLVSSDHVGSGETLSKEPDVQRPRVKLPVVTDVLPKPNFTNDWIENTDLRNVRKHGVVEGIPDMDVLSTLNAKKLIAIYHSYMDNTNILCHRKLRMGKVRDGGWEVCDDYEWRPMRPCVIYSFGINNDFSFDDDAGRVYGCSVYSFDPSMYKQPTYQRSGRVAFYRLGIGGQYTRIEKRTKNDWVLYTLSAFRAMLNHSDTPIDVLKMDVERSEWPALTTMLKEDQLFNVRQLLLEYHNKEVKADTLRPFLKVVGDVERQGFKKFYVHKNPACNRNFVGFPISRTSCYEVHYVNTKFVRAN